MKTIIMVLVAALSGCIEEESRPVDAGAGTVTNRAGVYMPAGFPDCEEFDYTTTRDCAPIVCRMLRCKRDVSVVLWCSPVVNAGAR